MFLCSFLQVVICFPDDGAQKRFQKLFVKAGYSFCLFFPFLFHFLFSIYFYLFICFIFLTIEVRVLFSFSSSSFFLFFLFFFFYLFFSFFPFLCVLYLFYFLTHWSSCEDNRIYFSSFFLFFPESLFF